ncbi:MAG: hypothetical protein RLZZ609_1022 [Cyanobacteriota bacterium]|jgi:hypothetical protein
MRAWRAHVGTEGIRFWQIGEEESSGKPFEPDSASPSTSSAPPNDWRLTIGLVALFFVLMALALAVHWLLPKSPGGNASSTPNLTNGSPMLTRPQLLETQQAMQETADFDAQNPPPSPLNGGGALGTPGPPSSLGTGAFDQ